MRKVLTHWASPPPPSVQSIFLLEPLRLFSRRLFRGGEPLLKDGLGGYKRILSYGSIALWVGFW